MNAQQAGKQIDYGRRADNLKVGNPGLTEESVAFGLRRAREIFERRHNPIKVELSELQLAAIMAGAHNDGGGEGFKADLRARLEDMGVGEDVSINDGDAVDFLNELMLELDSANYEAKHGPRCAQRFHGAAECTCGKAERESQEPLNYGGTN